MCSSAVTRHTATQPPLISLIAPHRFFSLFFFRALKGTAAAAAAPPLAHLRRTPSAVRGLAAAPGALRGSRVLLPFPSAAPLRRAMPRSVRGVVCHALGVWYTCCSSQQHRCGGATPRVGSGVSCAMRSVYGLPARVVYCRFARPRCGRANLLFLRGGLSICITPRLMLRNCCAYAV